MTDAGKFYKFLFLNYHGRLSFTEKSDISDDEEKKLMSYEHFSTFITLCKPDSRMSLINMMVRNY